MVTMDTSSFVNFYKFWCKGFFQTSVLVAVVSWTCAKMIVHGNEAKRLVNIDVVNDHGAYWVDYASCIHCAFSSSDNSVYFNHLNNWESYYWILINTNDGFAVRNVGRFSNKDYYLSDFKDFSKPESTELRQK